MTLKEALAEIKTLQGDADKRVVYSHEKFVEPMLKYIVEDFELSRISMNDNSIGGLFSDSSDQAKKMYEIFQSTYTENKEDESLPMAAEPSVSYSAKKSAKRKVKSAAVMRTI